MPNEEIIAGPHCIERLAPDFMVYRIRGPLEAEQLVALMSGQRRIQREYGYALVAVDLRGFDGVSSATMRAVRDPSAQRIPRAIAVFGASFAARVVADLIFRALQRLLPRRILVRFVETEAEALAFLDDARESILSELQSHPTPPRG